MTVSFLWWLSIVKAPNVEKKNNNNNNNNNVTCARYECITN